MFSRKKTTAIILEKKHKKRKKIMWKNTVAKQKPCEETL
jgi:hypothetical protein